MRARERNRRPATKARSHPGFRRKAMPREEKIPTNAEGQAPAHHPGHILGSMAVPIPGRMERTLAKRLRFWTGVSMLSLSLCTGHESRSKV
jgi:hypothetical protein